MVINLFLQLLTENNFALIHVSMIRMCNNSVANPRDFMIPNAKIGSKKHSIQVRFFSYILAITERTDTS